MNQENKKHKVVIVDDHSIVREGLKNSINSSQEFIVVGDFSSGKELLSSIREIDCDLILLDVAMPETSGITILEELLFRFPDVKVMILSMHKEKVFIKQALLKGAHGYVLKSDSLDELFLAMTDIINGKKYFSKQIIDGIIDDYTNFTDRPKSLDELTEREIEVLKLLAKGMSAKEAAKELNISQRTVESHKYKIMEKLQISNTTDLIKFAIFNDII